MSFEGILVVLVAISAPAAALIALRPKSLALLRAFARELGGDLDERARAIAARAKERDYYN